MKWHLLAATIVIATLSTTGCKPSGFKDSSSATLTTKEKIGNLEIQGKTWQLDSSSSRITFASIKADEFIETHYFSKLSGHITANGEAKVTVYLNDLETRIDIRNKRMRDMFFETRKFPKATIKASVDVENFSDLAMGERRPEEIEGTLFLHGKESTIYANVFVTRIAEARVEVASTEPVIVYVSDYNLESGLESLREIANLPSITGVVPVTFSLVFDMQG